MGLTFCHCKASFHWSVQPLSPPKAGHFCQAKCDPHFGWLSKGGFFEGVALDRQARQWIQVEALWVQEERRAELNLGLDGAALREPVAGTQIVAAVEHNTRRNSDQSSPQTHEDDNLHAHRGEFRGLHGRARQHQPHTTTPIRRSWSRQGQTELKLGRSWRRWRRFCRNTSRSRRRWRRRVR